MRALPTVFSALLLGLAVDPSTWAAERDSGFQFQIAPYFWAASIDGTVATSSGNEIADFDASFSDLVDNTDAAVMIFGDARWDRVGVLADFSWVGFSQDGDTPGPAFSGARLESDVYTVSAAPYFRVVQGTRFDLDVLAGLRYWDTSVDLKLKPGVLPARDASKDTNWTDYIAGARGQFRFSPKWFLTGYADYGIGGDSDKTWQAYGGLGYQFNDTWSMQLGYRELKVKYDSGGFVYDTTERGLLAGVGIRF